MNKHSIMISRYIIFISLACLKKTNRTNSEKELYNLLKTFNGSEDSQSELNNAINKYIGLTKKNYVDEPNREIVIFLKNDVSELMKNENNNKYKTILTKLKKYNSFLAKWEIYDHCYKNIINTNSKKNRNKYLQFRLTDFWDSSQISHTYKNEMYCGYCKMELVQVSSGKKIGYYELDHVYPKSKYPGLMYYAPNLMPSCKTCNSKKSKSDYLNSEEIYDNLKKINKNRNKVSNIDDYLEIKFTEPTLSNQRQITFQDFALIPEIRILKNTDLTNEINLKNRVAHMSSYFSSEADKFSKLLNSDQNLIESDSFQVLTNKPEFQVIFGSDFCGEYIGEYEPFAIYRYKLFEEIYEIKKKLLE